MKAMMTRILLGILSVIFVLSCSKSEEPRLNLSPQSLEQTQWDGTCYPQGGSKEDLLRVRLNFYTDSLLDVGFNGGEWDLWRAQKSIHKIDRRQMSLTISEEEPRPWYRPWPLYGATWILVEQRKDYMKFDHSPVPGKPTWILELQRKR